MGRRLNKLDPQVAVNQVPIYGTIQSIEQICVLAAKLTNKRSNTIAQHHACIMIP